MASYCIYTSTIGSTRYYYAEAGSGQSSYTVGTIIYGGPGNAGGIAGTNAQAVTQATLDSRPDGTSKLDVVMHGNFFFASAVSIPSFVKLIVNGKITATVANQDIFQIYNVNNVEVDGGVYNLNSLGWSAFDIEGSDASGVAHDITLNGVQVYNGTSTWEIQDNYKLGSALPSNYNYNIQFLNVLVDGSTLAGSSEAMIVVNTRNFVVSGTFQNGDSTLGAMLAIYGYDHNGKVSALLSSDKCPDTYIQQSSNILVAISSYNSYVAGVKLYNANQISIGGTINFHSSSGEAASRFKIFQARHLITTRTSMLEQ